MSQKEITILQLYPQEMNIYGDWGNVLTIKKRLEWLGYRAKVTYLNIGDSFPADIDIIMGGGGQDSNQELVAADIARHRESLAELVSNGTPALLICGLYQLFGHSFTTTEGKAIPGIGVFDIATSAGPSRLSGNTIIDTSEFGEIVGYENHSGRTTLGPDINPFGKVIQGDGNNGKDQTEGARLNNAIGTYLHGPLLPKNPILADFMIRTAVERRYGEFNNKPISDPYVERAREIAKSRPR